MLFFFQREFHVHCAPDPMSADPEKQTTVSVNYLLGRYVCNDSLIVVYYVEKKFFEAN